MLGSLLLATGVRPARAQDARCAARGAGTERCAAGEIVVLGTRSAESAQRASVRTGVVTREEAERRGARNVAEALAGEPTLQVNPEAYAPLGSPSGVQMQGLDADRVLILVDGARVTGDSGGVVDLAQLPLADVERIEYVQGPTSALYGSAALGGVVNVITSPPKEPGKSGRFRLELRSRGAAHGSATVALRSPSHWFAFDSSLNRTPHREVSAPRPGWTVPDRQTTLLGLRAGVEPNARNELRLNLRWLHDQRLGRTSEVVPGLGAYQLELPDAFDRFIVRAQQRLLLSSKARLQVSLEQSYFRGDSRRQRPGTPFLEARDREHVAHAFETTLELPWGAAHWLVGVRTEAERFSQQLKRVEPTSDGPRSSRATEVAPTLLANAALFAQLLWKPLRGVTVVPGARAEFHDRYGGFISPRLSLAWQPRDEVGVRLSFGRGFRAPSAKEYGFYFDHSAIGYRVLGNAELTPERSWGVNADLSSRPNSWLFLRAGAFANWIDQLIATRLAPTQPDPFVLDYVYVNIASATTAGADVFVRARRHGLGSFEGSYAYLWTRDRTENTPLPNRPQHTVTLALEAPITSGITARARYRWVSSAFFEQALRSPGFALLDVRLAYALPRELEAYVGFLNGLDERREPGRLADTRPSLGRTFYIGVRGELTDEERADGH